MKIWCILALLAITTIASAQPRHNNGKGHYKHKKEYRYNRNHYKNHRKVMKQHYKRDYHYHINREMTRYDFLNLSRQQRAKLQISINYLISNGYGPQLYERRLRSDLRNILTRSQYQQWEQRAYGSNNVFVFNFGR